MIKQNKAITLIALIITIIVLLILAGVTINMVLGENGLFNKARTSVGKYENTQKKENTVLTGYETEIDNARETVTISKDEYNQMKEEIENLKNANSYSTEEKVIGTWTNGKKLYQKTIFTRTPTEVGKNTAIANLNFDFENIMIISGMMLQDTITDPINNEMARVWIRTTSKEIAMRVNLDQYVDKECYITIQYTKTTDTVTI